MGSVVGAELVGEFSPDGLRQQRQWRLVGVSKLADPAPISARLLVGDLTFLDQHHGRSAFRQIIRCFTTDDAAAYDDNIGCGFD